MSAVGVLNKLPWDPLWEYLLNDRSMSSDDRLDSVGSSSTLDNSLESTNRNDDRNGEYNEGNKFHRSCSGVPSWNGSLTALRSKNQRVAARSADRIEVPVSPGDTRGTSLTGRNGTADTDLPTLDEDVDDFGFFQSSFQQQKSPIKRNDRWDNLEEVGPVDDGEDDNNQEKSNNFFDDDIDQAKSNSVFALIDWDDESQRNQPPPSSLEADKDNQAKSFGQNPHIIPPTDSRDSLRNAGDNKPGKKRGKVGKFFRRFKRPNTSTGRFESNLQITSKSPPKDKVPGSIVSPPSGSTTHSSSQGIATSPWIGTPPLNWIPPKYGTAQPTDITNHSRTQLTNQSRTQLTNQSRTQLGSSIAMARSAIPPKPTPASMKPQTNNGSPIISPVAVSDVDVGISGIDIDIRASSTVSSIGGLSVSEGIYRDRQYRSAYEPLHRGDTTHVQATATPSFDDPGCRFFCNPLSHLALSSDTVNS